MLLSGLPPVVREQDDFAAMFTLRNTTAAPLDAKLAWAVRDKAPADASGKVLLSGEQQVSLAANESRLVALPVKVPLGVPKLYWETTATSGSARDVLRVTQDVIEVYPVRVYQATLQRLDQPVGFPVQHSVAMRCRDAAACASSCMSTLAGDLSAVREWFHYYPYSCLEQRASKAIGLRDEAMWKSVAAVGRQLSRSRRARALFPDRCAGGQRRRSRRISSRSPRPTGASGPRTRCERMLGGLESFVAGRIVRGSGASHRGPHHPQARRDRGARAPRPRASRDARCDHASIRRGGRRRRVIDWIGILQRVEGIQDREAKKELALSILRSRLNFQGTVMTFSTEKSDALWWLMVSADVNANRALLAVLDDARRGRRTSAASCAAPSRGNCAAPGARPSPTPGARVALARYSEAFEATPVTGSTRITLAGDRADVEIGDRKKVVDLAWPRGQGEPHAAALRRGRALVHRPVARRIAPEGAALDRLSHHAHRERPSTRRTGAAIRAATSTA